MDVLGADNLPFEQSIVFRSLFNTWGGGVLPYNRVMGMCRWMGSHFQDWIDYNGVAFSIELIEWGRTLSDFLG